MAEGGRCAQCLSPGLVGVTSCSRTRPGWARCEHGDEPLLRNASQCRRGLGPTRATASAEGRPLPHPARASWPRCTHTCPRRPGQRVGEAALWNCVGPQGPRAQGVVCGSTRSGGGRRVLVASCLLLAGVDTHPPPSRKHCCPREAPPGRPGYWALVRPPSSLEAAGTSGLCPYLWPLLSSPTAPHGALITAKHCPLSMSLCGTVPPHPGPHHWGGSGSHVKADAAHAHTCTHTRICPSDHAEAS